MDKFHGLLHHHLLDDLRARVLEQDILGHVHVLRQKAHQVAPGNDHSAQILGLSEDVVDAVAEHVLHVLFGDQK